MKLQHLIQRAEASLRQMLRQAVAKGQHQAFLWSPSLPVSTLKGSDPHWQQQLLVACSLTMLSGKQTTSKQTNEPLLVR